MDNEFCNRKLVLYKAIHFKMIIVETFKMNFLASQVGLPIGVETFNANTLLHMSPKI